MFDKFSIWWGRNGQNVVLLIWLVAILIMISIPLFAKRAYVCSFIRAEKNGSTTIGTRETGRRGSMTLDDVRKLEKDVKGIIINCMEVRNP